MLIHLYKLNSSEVDIECQHLMAPIFSPASLSKISSQAPKPYVNLTTDQISVMWVPILFPTEGEHTFILFMLFYVI